MSAPRAPSPGRTRGPRARSSAERPWRSSNRRARNPHRRRRSRCPHREPDVSDAGGTIAGVSLWFASEEFNEDEREVLRPYFTNLDEPVFALVNLPEVTKGALFARYSRSPKSLRRMFLDEFAEHAEEAAGSTEVGAERAEELY